jgi:hypothetical protein
MSPFVAAVHRSSIRLLGACLGLTVLASTTSAQGAPAEITSDPLVGTWEHNEDYGGVGTRSVLVFFADGAFSHVVAATTTARYQVTGNELMISPPSGPPIRMTISIAGDTLRQMAAGVFQKVGRDPTASGDAGLVGRWSGRTSTGAEITQTFTRDGNFRQESPVGGEVGRYEVAGEKILWTVQLPKKSTRKTGFIRAGDKLQIITPGENTPMEYAKAR